MVKWGRKNCCHKAAYNMCLWSEISCQYHADTSHRDVVVSSPLANGQHKSWPWTNFPIPSPSYKSHVVLRAKEALVSPDDHSCFPLLDDISYRNQLLRSYYLFWLPRIPKQSASLSWTISVSGGFLVYVSSRHTFLDYLMPVILSLIRRIMVMMMMENNLGALILCQVLCKLCMRSFINLQNNLLRWLVTKAFSIFQNEENGAQKMWATWLRPGSVQGFQPTCCLILFSEPPLNSEEKEKA